MTQDQRADKPSECCQGVCMFKFHPVAKAMMCPHATAEDTDKAKALLADIDYKGASHHEGVANVATHRVEQLDSLLAVAERERDTWKELATNAEAALAVARSASATSEPPVAWMSGNGFCVSEFMRFEGDAEYKAHYNIPLYRAPVSASEPIDRIDSEMELWAMTRAYTGCKTDEEMVEQYGYGLELIMEPMRKARAALDRTTP